jgi:hypothetical protein
MARGGHGLPKVASGPTMPYPSMPCKRATPETALWPFQGWFICWAGGLRPVFYPFGYPTPYAYASLIAKKEKSSSKTIKRTSGNVEELLSKVVEKCLNEWKKTYIKMVLLKGPTDLDLTVVNVILFEFLDLFRAINHAFERQVLG